MKQIYSKMLLLLMMVLVGNCAWAQSYFEKVTTAPEDWRGDYLIVYEGKEDAYAFDGGLATLDAADNKQKVTITDGKILAAEPVMKMIFTVDHKGDSKEIYNLKSASGLYISGTTVSAKASNGIKSDASDKNYEITFGFEEGNAVIYSKSSDANMILRYNSGSGQNRFRFYKTGQQPISLYKYVENGEVTEPETPISYAITIANNIKGGTVSASATEAVEGTSITLTATPDEDFEFTSWSVTNATTNDAISVSNNSFTMPAAKVIVSATFTQKEVEGGDEPEDGDGLIITYNFNDKAAYPEGFPTGGTNVAAAMTTTISGNPLIINAPTSYYIINSTNDASRGLFFGKTSNSNSIPQNGTAYLGFPAKSGYKLTKAVVTTTASCAGGLPVNIYNTTWEAMSTSQNTVNGVEKTFTFDVTSAEENTEYRITAGGSSGKNLQFKKIVLTYAKAEPTYKITFSATDGSDYWTSFSNSQNVVIPAMIELGNDEYASLTAYSVIVIDNELMLDDLSKDCNDGDNWHLPANTGYLLKAETTTAKAPTFICTFEEESMGTVDAEYNMLRPSSAEMTGDFKFYKLAYGDFASKTGLGFYYGAEDGAAFESKAGLAYLAVPTASAGAKAYPFVGESTSISMPTLQTATETIYNLNGQRLNSLQKGINLVGGKKIFVK